MQKKKGSSMMPRPQSTPPLSQYMHAWAATSLPHGPSTHLDPSQTPSHHPHPSQATSPHPHHSQAPSPHPHPFQAPSPHPHSSQGPSHHPQGPSPHPHRSHHRHSMSSYASILPQPIYHPLQQHKRGSNIPPGGPPMRRISSPDIKVNHPTYHSSGQDLREGRGTPQIRTIVRRNSFQGMRAADVNTRQQQQQQHRRSQTDKPRERMMTDGGVQRHLTDTGVIHHPPSHAGSQDNSHQATRQTTAGPGGSALSTSRQEKQQSYAQSSQIRPGHGSPTKTTNTSDPSFYSRSQELGSNMPLQNRGEAWQLEEEDGVRGSRPSGHVDEALFSTRIPRHYFHSSHPHTSAHSQLSEAESSVPHQHWSLSVSDRQMSPGSQENSLSGGYPGEKTQRPPNVGTKKILTTQQQRVAEWVQNQTDSQADDKSDGHVTHSDDYSDDHVTYNDGHVIHSDGHVTHSLPRSLTQSRDMETRRLRATRTFSYIQAQVHPVDAAEDTPPHKGFDPRQMMIAEHQRSGSLIETQSTSSHHSHDILSSPAHRQPRPRPQSSPHPHRARTKSSPNPVLRRNAVVKKVRGQPDRELRGGLRGSAVHPDKRFSTGNITAMDVNRSLARFDIRRSASPIDGQGHVTSHTPSNEEETTSSDDTGGQSDSERIQSKNKRRSKSSSGSLMAKIARKLGRIATKQDQSDPFESPPPFGEDCGDGEERDESSGGNHTLQVPIPRVQQKKMKSISTSHLEKGLDGSHHRQSSLTGSLTDRSYSPDYCRTQDDTRYRSHGTPPPGPGTPHGTPYGTPKMPRSSALSSRSHRRKSVEPDPEGTVFRAGSKRNLTSLNEALLDAVEQGNFEAVQRLLETNATPELLNITNEDDFTLVDLAAMLGYHDIAKQLLAHGARDSTRFSRDPFLRFRHIVTLLTETERELDSLRYELVVQSSSSSAVRDMERRLKRQEWRVHLFEQMKANYESADLPDVPTDISLHVSSSQSLTVRFSEPVDSNGAPVTRYKIEWCLGSSQFSPIVGEFVLTDLRTNEYIIPDLNKGEQYFVRVSAYNMKGFGRPQPTTPPSAIPSSWHDQRGSHPRFEGSTDNIHIISAKLNMSLSNSPPTTPPPVSGTPSTYRKATVKKSISKLFGTNAKFQKSLRPGVYISSLVYCDDSKVAVTMDEQLPVVEISDSPAASSIGSDFVWLAKVACTWDQVKGMVDVSDSYTSSPAIQSRNKMLHGILELQTTLGLQDLGLLHPVPYRDSHGAVVFVIVQYVKDPRSVQSSSLKWMTLPRLWKKRPQADPAGDLHTVPVSDQLILDAQEIIAHHGNSTRPLTRGLYLGYLKARSTVASMKVICSREYPNVLPHHKIRENPNISQEEWQWLQALTSSTPTPLSPSRSPSSPPSRPPTPPLPSSPHSLQRLLPTTIDTFLHNLGICKEDAEKHRLYCHEVIELNEDISLLLILPPADQVCTPPGSTDHFARLSNFVALPINTFEIMQLYTYQKAFMTKFSTVSARLDIELLTSQQRMREAFSKAEVSAAKQLKEELESFHERTELAWKEMRWIEEAVQRGRSLQSTTPSDSSLLPVKVFRDVAKSYLPTGLRGSTVAEPSSGYLRVFPAYSTGLINGTSVKLFITESTTASEVICLVVQQLEKARLEKAIPGAPLTEHDISDFFLVARRNGKETTLDYNYTPLQLQTQTQHKWRLLVRRISGESTRRTNEQTTNV